jgi:hypothetical protein
MVFEEVERLQREYTDKYVEVDTKRPELARFADYTGIVKTINYNGRALVEFLDYNQNIGWYDIGLDYLKIVPKPDPNAKKEKAAKAAPVAKAATAKAADAKPVRKPVVGSKLSNQEILACAQDQGSRGNHPEGGSGSFGRTGCCPSKKLLLQLPWKNQRRKSLPPNRLPAERSPPRRPTRSPGVALTTARVNL